MQAHEQINALEGITLSSHGDWIKMQSSGRDESKVTLKLFLQLVALFDLYSLTFHFTASQHLDKN